MEEAWELAAVSEEQSEPENVSTEYKIAKLAFFGVVLTALLGLLGVVINGFFGVHAANSQAEIKTIASADKNKSIDEIMPAGITPLSFDFTSKLELKLHNLYQPRESELDQISVEVGDSISVLVGIELSSKTWKSIDLTFAKTDCLPNLNCLRLCVSGAANLPNEILELSCKSMIFFSEIAEIGDDDFVSAWKAVGLNDSDVVILSKGDALLNETIRVERISELEDNKIVLYRNIGIGRISPNKIERIIYPDLAEEKED